MRSTAALVCVALRISAAALEIEDKVIAWRRDIHEHPELSYQETRSGRWSPIIVEAAKSGVTATPSTQSLA